LISPANQSKELIKFYHKHFDWNSTTTSIYLFSTAWFWISNWLLCCCGVKSSAEWCCFAAWCLFTGLCRVCLRMLH